MPDPTTEKFTDRLSEIRSEIQRLKARIARAEKALDESLKSERTIVDALRLVGALVPDADQARIAEAGAKRRPSGKLRAIDAALQAVSAGETVSKHEVAKRVTALGISFESANLANALATAMTRSPQFRNHGRGNFERVPSVLD